MIDFHRLMKFWIVIYQVWIYILLICLIWVYLNVLTILSFDLHHGISVNILSERVLPIITCVTFFCHTVLYTPDLKLSKILPLNASYFVFYFFFPIGLISPAPYGSLVCSPIYVQFLMFVGLVYSPIYVQFLAFVIVLYVV